VKLSIIGATGFVGRVLAHRALGQGHQVRALVRNPAGLGDLVGKVEVVRGDLSRAEDLETLVQGADALVSTAGPPRTGRHDSEPFRESMTSLVRAMHRHDVMRFMMITGAAARMPGESLGLKRGALRAVLKIVMPDVIRTKDIELAIVCASGLRWTVIRPPRISSGAPLGAVSATDTDLAGVRLDVVDLVEFMLASLQSSEWVGRAPTVASCSPSDALRHVS
jgi:nucleoside-diphosphate-sugar epimerase